jgi:Uma2 family endonuclease
VWWVSEARKPRRGDLDLDGLPDLVVEVRSPSTWRLDLGPKRARYGESGIAELWLVDTEVEVVTVHRRTAPGTIAYDVALDFGVGDTLASPLLPGFELPVADVFRV